MWKFGKCWKVSGTIQHLCKMNNSKLFYRKRAWERANLQIEGIFLSLSHTFIYDSVYFVVALLALYTSVHPPQPRISWKDAELYVNRFGAQLDVEIELDLSATPLQIVLSSSSHSLLCTSELPFFLFFLEMAYAIGKLWVRLVGEKGLKEITEVSSLQREQRGDTFLSNGFKLKGICVMVNYYRRHSSTDM